MVLSEDLKEFLELLNSKRVEDLVVGALDQSKKPFRGAFPQKAPRNRPIMPSTNVIDSQVILPAPRFASESPY